MTARWSGAARTRKAKAPGGKAVSRSNVGGFPTALGGQSPEEVFLTGARDVNVGCRSGFEASWRSRPRKRRKAVRGATSSEEEDHRSGRER
jgi:hypothetical protein